MKVLFVYHNQLEGSFIPASISVLSGYLKNNGIDTKLFDTTFMREENNKDVIDWKMREKTGEFKHCDNNIEFDIVNFKEEFNKVYNEYRPDIIAISSTSFEFEEILKFIGMKNTITIIGGSHATVNPIEVISRKEIDIVCIGEGEEALLELCKKIENNEDYTNINNLWVKKDNHVFKNKLRKKINMNEVKPDWDIFDERHMIRPYEGEIKRYGYFEISRGCPNNCSYCINSKLHKIDMENDIKEFYRYYKPEVIVKIMKEFKEKYKFNHVQLYDENLLTMPIEILRELSRLYKENINVPFFSMGRPEYIANEPEKAKLIKEMGCDMLAFGLESGNKNLREKVLKRYMNDETLIKASQLLKENGIKVSLYNIIGFPTETIEMIFETIELNRKIKPYRLSVRFLYPYPGTKIRDLCEEYITSNNSYLLEPVLNLPSPPHPTKEQLIKIRIDFNKLVNMEEKDYLKYKQEFLKNE